MQFHGITAAPHRILWKPRTEDHFYNRLVTDPNTIVLGDSMAGEERDFGKCTWASVLEWEAAVSQCRQNDTQTTCGFRVAVAPIVVVECRLPQLLTEDQVAIFRMIKTPMVLLVIADSNWGFMSTWFPDRSTTWGVLERTFRSRKCAEARKLPDGTVKRPWCEIADFVSTVLDDPRVRAVFTIQHHNFTHPKVHMFPLGSATDPADWAQMTSKLRLFDPTWDRPKLVINSNDNRNKTGRPGINKLLRERLGITNDYGFEPNWARRLGSAKMCARLRSVTMRARRCMSALRFTCSYMSCAHAHARGPPQATSLELVNRNDLRIVRRLISPSGLGVDCRRNWMALPYSGTVPVMEAGMGMERAWARLPAIFVRDYADLTWPLLQQAWAEIIYNAPLYDFSHLTMRYWEHDVLRRVSLTGNASFLERVHPLPLRRIVQQLPPSEVQSCSATRASTTAGPALMRTCVIGNRTSVDNYPIVEAAHVEPRLAVIEPAAAHERLQRRRGDLLDERNFPSGRPDAGVLARLRAHAAPAPLCSTGKRTQGSGYAQAAAASGPVAGDASVPQSAGPATVRFDGFPGAVLTVWSQHSQALAAQLNSHRSKRRSWIAQTTSPAQRQAHAHSIWGTTRNALRIARPVVTYNGRAGTPSWPWRIAWIRVTCTSFSAPRGRYSRHR
jgi:hypothetical protein